MRELALSYGVIAVYQPETNTSREYLHNGLKLMIDRGWITRDDLIAYIGGAFGEGGGSTFLEIDPVGKVLDCYNSYLLPNSRCMIPEASTFWKNCWKNTS